MMNIHEVGGWHPLLTAVRPLAPPLLSMYQLQQGGGMSARACPFLYDWGAGWWPSDYCGGRVSMPACLWGQLRGCLNVVTDTGESNCCVIGCTYF